MSDAVSRKLEIQVENLNKEITNLSETKKRQTFQYHNDIQRLRQDKTALTDAVFILKKEFEELLKKRETINEDIKLFQESQIAKIRQDIESSKQQAQVVIDQSKEERSKIEQAKKSLSDRERRIRVHEFDNREESKKLERQERRLETKTKQVEEEIKQKEDQIKNLEEEVKNNQQQLINIINQKTQESHQLDQIVEKYKKLMALYIDKDEELKTRAGKLATIELEQKHKAGQLKIKETQLKDRQQTLDRAFKELRSKHGQ